MICARINVYVDTGVSPFYISLDKAEYLQSGNASAHLNSSANSNKFELVPYHCETKVFRGF